MDKEQLLPPPQPSAPPPAYQAAPPPYSGPPPPQAAGYYGAAPPPQAAGYYGAAPPQQQATSNVTVISAQPVVRQNVYLNVKPPNYLVMSVIVLFFFCWIFGLIALFTSLQVDSAWASGDRVGAAALSARARGYNIAGIIIGIVVYVVIVVAAVVANVSIQASY